VSEPLLADRLREMLRTPGHEIDLALGALLIAADHHPRFDLGAALAAYETLVSRAARAAARRSDPRTAALSLSHFFFSQQAWSGAVGHYFDPRSAFLNEVMAQGSGIPEVLAIPYMGALQRLDLSVGGVLLPGQFLICLADTVYVDLFDRGKVLDAAAIAALIRQTQGHHVGTDCYPRPLGARDLLVRILTTLRSAFMARGETEHALLAVQRLLQAEPRVARHYADRGHLRKQLGNWWAAADDFSHFLAQQPASAEASRVREELQKTLHLAFRLN
jgi:regulator of sirC expression with transglutaminase-like and TPR domain